MPVELWEARSKLVGQLLVLKVVSAAEGVASSPSSKVDITSIIII